MKSSFALLNSNTCERIAIASRVFVISIPLHLSFLLGLLCTLLPVSGAAQIPAKAPRYSPITYEQAVHWCDSMPLHNPEGIYSYPDRGIIVLVRALNRNRATARPGECEIVCVMSEDLLIPPGQVVGYLSPTVDQSQVKLTLFERINLKHLSQPKTHTAKYNPSQGTLSFQRVKRKITFNPLTLIPHIGRTLRITTQGTDALPSDGLVKLYPPVTTSPGYSRQFPRYF